MKKTVRKIILSGGGTGGHIYPALALLEELRKSTPDVEVLYMGNPQGLESKIVPQYGIEFRGIETSGFKRSLSLHNVRAIWQFLSGGFKAKKMIDDFQPDIVIGTGGFVCAPVLFAAAKSKIPTLIHEQNSVAGVTNKFLSKYVDVVAICFEEAKKYFNKTGAKVVLTGNPRGQEVVGISEDKQLLVEQYQLNPTLPTVLIFGGSRGAPAINEAAVSAIESFSNKPYQVIIATGAVHFENLELDKEQLPLNIRLVPYVDDMPNLMRNIDLVVCRSGATTLAELTALGKASVLIPSPYVTENHQEHNAMALVNKDAAVMIKEKDLTTEHLVREIDDILLNPDKLSNMEKASKALGVTDASSRLVHLMEEIIR